MQTLITVNEARLKFKIGHREVQSEIDGARLQPVHAVKVNRGICRLYDRPSVMELLESRQRKAEAQAAQEQADQEQAARDQEAKTQASQNPTGPSPAMVALARVEAKIDSNDAAMRAELRALVEKFNQVLQDFNGGMSELVDQLEKRGPALTPQARTAQ